MSIKTPKNCTQTSGIYRNFIDSAGLSTFFIEPYASIAAASLCPKKELIKSSIYASIYASINFFQELIFIIQVSSVNNALKGQRYVSPGQVSQMEHVIVPSWNPPGYADKCEFRPVRAKDLYLKTILLPLQGAYMAVIRYPGRCPGLTSHFPFGALSY